MLYNHVKYAILFPSRQGEMVFVLQEFQNKSGYTAMGERTGGRDESKRISKQNDSFPKCRGDATLHY